MILPNWMSAFIFCLFVVSAVLEAVNANWTSTLLWLLGSFLWLIASLLNDRAKKISRMSALSAMIYSFALADVTLIWASRENWFITLVMSGLAIVFAIASITEYRDYKTLKKHC